MGLWSWITGRGSSELAQPKPDPVPARPGPPQSMGGTPLYSVLDLSSHAGRNLSPSKLLSAYDLAESGDPLCQCDIFDDRIMVDAHLRSTLETRVESVARKHWVIQEGGDSRSDRKAARELEERLRLVPNFIDTLEHQLRFNWYGYSGTEIDWRPVDGMIAPTWFENVAPRCFRFDRQDRPLLLTRETVGAGEPLRAGRWWMTTRSGGRIATTGLMTTATWWSMFKSYSIRDWLNWINRYGIPSVHGVYKSGQAQPEDIETLKKAVKAIGRDGWSVFSDACEIVITEAKAGGKASDAHGAMAAMCDAQISKLINGATQNIETGAAGSYAQAKVHEGRAFDLLAGDAERLSHSFELAIGLPFVRYNGLPARPPRLKIHIVRDMSPESRLRIFAGARNDLGLRLDEDQVRQELQLKSPTGAVIEPPAAPAPTEPAKEESDGTEQDPA